MMSCNCFRTFQINIFVVSTQKKAFVEGPISNLRYICSSDWNTPILPN